MHVGIRLLRLHPVAARAIVVRTFFELLSVFFLASLSSQRSILLPRSFLCRSFSCHTIWARPKRQDMHSELPSSGSFFATAGIASWLAIFASPLGDLVHDISLLVRSWFPTASHTIWVRTLDTSILSWLQYSLWTLQRFAGTPFADSTSGHLTIQTFPSCFFWSQ